MQCHGVRGSCALLLEREEWQSRHGTGCKWCVLVELLRPHLNPAPHLTLAPLQTILVEKTWTIDN